MLATKSIVHYIDVEVELPHTFRLERRGLEFDNYIGMQLDIVENKVGIEIRIVYFKMLLLCDKSKAITHFKQILGDVLHELSFNISLIYRFRLLHHIKDIRIFHQIVGEVALWIWVTHGKVIHLLSLNLTNKEIGHNLHCRTLLLQPLATAWVIC